jgi:hypothetical protein
MSEKSNSPSMGQEINEGSTPDKLDDLFKTVQAVAPRLDRVEGAAEGGDAGDENDDPSYVGSPPFAVRSDGALLMSTEHAKGRDVTHRELWIGFVLCPGERNEVIARMDDRLCEVASLIAVKMPGEGSRS